MAYIYLAVAFSLNAVANILLKIGSRGGVSLSSSIPHLVFHNWQLILGCILFAANVLFYFLALRALPISVAYPIMVVMSFIIINAYAFFALSESITPLQVLGYVFIILGLVLVVSQLR